MHLEAIRFLRIINFVQKKSLHNSKVNIAVSIVRFLSGKFSNKNLYIRATLIACLLFGFISE